MSRKEQAEYKKRSQLSIIWNRLRKNKLAMLGLAILVVMVALAVCADWIADYDTNVTGMNMAERLQTPSAKHWFGTDSYGRDVFARIIHGSRLSLSLSIFAMLAAVAIGSIIGAIIGAVILGMISNGLDLLSVNQFYRQIIVGAIIIIAVALERFTSLKTERV